MRGTCPIVPVADVAASVLFYTEKLGFSLHVDNVAHGYAMVVRDGAMIGLVTAADAQALHATRNNISAQIWTDSVDALWVEIKDALLTLPEGRVRAPFTQAYGTRELHVKCPDGFLMMFTESASTVQE